VTVAPAKLAKELEEANRQVAEAAKDYAAATARREALILQAVDAGNSKRQIALALDLATQRVQQIVDRARGRK
jgi:DNA-binding NarL/FixJ family response regulator